MIIEILVASISGVVAVSIAAIAYMQSKRLTFFETFFKRKADVFEEYTIAIGSAPRTENELYSFAAITRKVTLYCFEQNQKAILDFLDLAIKLFQSHSEDGFPEELQFSFRESRENIVNILRTEIQVSRKWKYQ